MKWMKNTSGKRDAMLTFAVIAFAVVMLKFIASGVILTLVSSTIEFGILDATLVASVLAPTFGAYVARRHTDRKWDPNAPLAGEGFTNDDERG